MAFTRIIILSLFFTVFLISPVNIVAQSDVSTTDVSISIQAPDPDLANELGENPTNLENNNLQATETEVEAGNTGQVAGVQESRNNSANLGMLMVIGLVFTAAVAFVAGKNVKPR